MPETSIVKAVNRDGLPEGKHEFTATERDLAMKHCRNLVRDANIAGTVDILYTAAAIYNWHTFGLHVTAGYEEGGIGESFTAEFGYSERQAYRFLNIGKELAEALGGGFITGRMINERIQSDIFKGRLGVRKIAELTRIKNGMQLLVAAKSEADVTTLLDQIATHASDLAEAKDAGEGASGKPGKKDAKRVKYSDKRPPSKDEFYQLERDLADQLHTLANGPLKRVCDAAKCIPTGERDNYRSTKLVNAGQSVYNNLWRVIEAVQEYLSPIHIDAIANAHSLERELNSDDRYRTSDAPRMQAAPAATVDELPEDDDEALKAMGIRSNLI